MNEHTVLEKIASNVEEAIALGLAELGMNREAVDIEILDEGSRGLLGIGGRQARVRLTVKEAEPIAEPNRESSIPIIKENPPETNEPAQFSEADFGILDDNLLFMSRQTVAELMEKMGIRASVEVHYGTRVEGDEEQLPVMVDIHGSDLGILIGRRAEILNALQYMVNLIVSKQVDHWVQVILDVEGYRARRERQLRQMAQRMADQAIRTGRRQVLEPMSAAERRIVHIELRDRPNVETQSIGEEPTRKVTIVPR
jgi:spoIIIJ-associated protein